ncbi:MAG: hypothetical protein D6788_01855 [Planctomycetota bacterium]|nr:MAG: hypothetical protein D6788_01855 [Planctomycetota bacterium]
MIDVLAAGGSSPLDWIEDLIPVLIVAGAILGNVAKKLIEAFGEKGASETPVPKGPEEIEFPVRRRRRRRGRGTPLKLEPVPELKEGMEPPAPLVPPPAVGRRRPDRPAPKATPRPRVPKARESAQPPPRPVVGTPARLRPPPPASKQGRRPLKPAISEPEWIDDIEEKEERFEENVEERIGHLVDSFETKKTHMAAMHAPPRAATSKWQRLFQSRQRLREAIVAYEVLGPPLALRDRYDIA